MRFFLLILLFLACNNPPLPSNNAIDSWTLEVTENESLDMIGVEVGEEKIWMSKTEVSWDIFDLFFLRPEEEMEADGITGPSKSVFPVTRGFGNDGMPALGMTLNSAESFCKWLSKREGHEYRLPTALEWRVAVGNSPSPLEDYAWTAGNANSTPHPIASKKANALGFHDLLGNLGEWCYDEKGKGIVCGGSYLEDSQVITPDFKQKYTLAWQNRDPQFPKSSWWMSDCGWVGFRIMTTQRPKSR